jgi:4-amino-4-deoxy-L-arabinose transferase-like glycosyltransferase
MRSKWYLKLNLEIFIIFIFSVFIYVYRLNSIPTSFHGDEGETALQALEILKGNAGLVGVGWFDLPLLSFVPHAAGMLLWGENIIGVRLGSVIFGLLTIPVFYLFVKELFKTRIAFISTLLLATSHLWIALSRFGTIYPQAAFLMIATLYFLFKALKTQKLIYFALTGIFLGLSFYSYYAIRILPFIMVIPIFYYLMRSGSSKKTLLQIGILIVSALVIFSPQGLFYLKTPNAFLSRTDAVYIFSETGRQWTNYNKSDPEILLEQTKRTFNIFAGDNSTQYGYKGQLLDWASIIFLILGLAYVFRRITSLNHLFIIVWLGLSLVGQILTTIPPPFFLPRFVVGLPVLYILIAQGIDRFYLLVKIKGVSLANIVIAVIIIYIVGTNIYTYFISYPKQTAGDPNARAATKIASYINSQSSPYSLYFMTEPALYPGFGTLKFLTGGKSLTLSATDSEQSIGSTSYIVYPHRLPELSIIMKKYPNGKLMEYRDIDGRIQFYIYKIE